MKIPATVITGFLGAGKTTLIRHLLENADGRRIALIINEFGDLGVDRDIVEGCGFQGCDDGDVVELANGCICCTVADDFLPTMEMLLDRDLPPDHILIETSGLALPKPLVRAFGWPEIRSRVTVDGVVAVVDSPAVALGQFADDPDAVQKMRNDDDMLDHHSPLEEVFEDQLLAADLVLLNKSDQVDAGALQQIRDLIDKECGRAVKQIATVKGNVDINVLLGIDARVEDFIETRKSHHDGEDDHDHDDFESFTVDVADVDDPSDLETMVLKAINDHGILRVKGFVNVPGKPSRLVVQGVGNRIETYYDRPWGAQENRISRLVVIGETGLDQDQIREALSSPKPASAAAE